MRPHTQESIPLAGCTLPTKFSPMAARDTVPPNPSLNKSPNRAARLVRAFVVDDRLSVLRRGADVRSQIMQRLRLGRRVYILGSNSAAGDQPKCYRVAVTRRTRGWIHNSAVAIPGRAGDDARLLRLAENAK